MNQIFKGVDLNMYFGFIPSLPNIQTRFSGFTENPFIFKRYSDMMKNFHINNELSESGYETKEDCISAMKSILEFNGYDPSDSIWGLEWGMNNLFSVEGKGISSKIVVLTDRIFDEFHEVYYNNSELYKTFSDLYRLCSMMSVKYLYSYILPTSETNIFTEIIKRIHDIWELNNIAKMSEEQIYGPDGLLSLNENGEMKLWDVLDQATQIELYIASEIVKNNLLNNTSRDSMYGEDFYDFDLR